MTTVTHMTEGDVALVSIADGQISQASRAHHAGNGGIAHNGNQGDGPPRIKEGMASGR